MPGGQMPGGQMGGQMGGGFAPPPPQGNMGLVFSFLLASPNYNC